MSPADDAPRATGRGHNPFGQQSQPPGPAAPQDGTGTEGRAAGPTGSAGPAGSAADSAGAVLGREVIDVDGHAVVVADMAPFDWSEAPADPIALTCKLGRQQGGGWKVTISWPAWNGPGVAVYRVAAGDGDRPDAPVGPEATLDVTTSTSVVDSTLANPPVAGVRYYEVWLHLGPTVEDAVRSAPFLYAGDSAQDRVVWPPSSFRVEASGRDLVASWEPMPDQRFRMRSQPVRGARRRPTPTDCQDVLPSGHQDRDVEPGVPYVYFLYAAVVIEGGVEWSAEPATFTAEVPVDLKPVSDLDVEPTEEGRVTLVWTSVPPGRVEIYTTAKAPPADLETAGQLTKDALREYPFHLDLDHQMQHPVREADGRSRMANVDVSAATGAVYFLPLTVHRQQVRPGRPRRWLQAQPPTNLVVVDRVLQVLIAFTWPRGAARVDLWRTAVDSTPDLSRPPTQSLSREDYEAFGGFLIDRNEHMITSGPCALHLAGYITHAGEAKHSGVATVREDFPAIVHYRFEAEQRSARRGGPTTRLALLSNESLHGVPVTLVHSPYRLPLSTDDGVRLFSQTVSLTARQPAALTGLPALPASGFVRLLADPYHRPAIALLDPPPAQLRLPHA